MSTSRWIRLDTTWSSSDWLAELKPEARLCWVELLCYVKAHGQEGRVRAMAPAVFARNAGVTRNAVTAMIEAAISDGALVVNGDEWTLTGWEKRNPKDATAARRMKQYRKRKKDDPELSTPAHSDGSYEALRRNVTAVTPTETETETVKKNPSGSKKATVLPPGWKPTPEHIKRAAELRLNLDREVDVFRAHAETHGRRVVSWNGAFTTWLLKAQTFANGGSTHHPPAVVARPAKGGGLYVGG